MVVRNSRSGHPPQRSDTCDFHDLDDQEPVSCTLHELRGHSEEFRVILHAQRRTPDVAGFSVRPTHHEHPPPLRVSYLLSTRLCAQSKQYSMT